MLILQLKKSKARGSISVKMEILPFLCKKTNVHKILRKSDMVCRILCMLGKIGKNRT